MVVEQPAKEKKEEPDLWSLEEGAIQRDTRRHGGDEGEDNKKQQKPQEKQSYDAPGPTYGAPKPFYGPPPS